MTEAYEGSLFDPGNIGSYPGRVVNVRPGEKNVGVLDLRQTDDRGAGIVTVMLSVQRGLPAAEILPLRAPIAHIEWGVSGGRDSVDVDFLHGQALSITATFIRIVASFPLADEVVFGEGELGEGFGVTDPDDEAQALILGASLGAMPLAKAAFGATPRLTTFVVMPNEGSVFVPVPNHAQSVTVLAPPTVPPIVVAAFTAQVTTALLYGATVAAGADVGALPLARGVEFIQVAPTVATGGTPPIVTLLWTIGL